MPMRRTLRPAALTLALAVGVSACSPSDAPSSAPGTSRASTASTDTQTQAQTQAQSQTQSAQAHVAATADEATTAVAFGTDRAQQPASPDAELVIADVRAGSHDGFDRVVFEYSGTGTPGFLIGYVPEPRQQASGLPLEVAGNAYLEVMIQGTPMGMLSQREDLIKAGPMDVAAGSIQGVTHGGVFEADTQYVLGVDQQRPFRAYTLENPTRLVVDVQR